MNQIVETYFNCIIELLIHISSIVFNSIYLFILYAIHERKINEYDFAIVIIIVANLLVGHLVCQIIQLNTNLYFIAVL